MATSAVDYVFGGDRNELERLLEQAEDLKPESSWLLDNIDIETGWRVADIGCGPIGVLDLLSERVGASGAVVGVEREARFAGMARAQIAKRGLSNVSIVEGDALGTSLEKDSFDLVHERLVLINIPVPDQQRLLSEMMTLARPGGTIAVESWDRASYVCYPEHASWRILMDAFGDAVRPMVGDRTSGRTLYSLLRSAGVKNVQTKVHVRAVEIGDRRRTHRLGIFDVTKPKILALGLMSEADFDRHRQAVADHLADPDTFLIDQLFVQAWGKRPSNR
jgi:ubiquinone/menaquinone biosynthesis C-methylase UbiE